jgi:hypothetical protein
MNAPVKKCECFIQYELLIEAQPVKNNSYFFL